MIAVWKAWRELKMSSNSQLLLLQNFGVYNTSSTLILKLTNSLALFKNQNVDLMQYKYHKIGLT